MGMPHAFLKGIEAGRSLSSAFRDLLYLGEASDCPGEGIRGLAVIPGKMIVLP